MSIESNIVVNTLKLLDFGASEITLYKILVENDYLTATEISKKTAIPRTKVYEILTKLELKNVIQRQNGRPLKYKALNPTSALQIRRKKIIEETEKGLELLQESWNQNESLDEFAPVSAYYGSNYYYSIMDKIKKGVKVSLFILMPYLVEEEEVELLKQIIINNVAKGVRIEIVLHPDVFNSFDDATKKIFKEQTSLLIVPVPMRVFIIDNEEFILQVQSSDSTEPVNVDDLQDIIIRLPDLVKTIEKSLRLSIKQVAT